MAFADTIGAVATVANLKEGETTTTIESKTNFFAAIPLGDTARAECTPLHKGRTTMVWQTEDHARRRPARRAGDADADGAEGAGYSARDSASFAPSPTKAAAKVRRIHVSTRGREMTWSRTEAANSP